MTRLSTDSKLRVAVLKQLLTSATNEASVAMSRWTDGLITLSLDEVEELPLEQVCDRLGLHDQMLHMVVLTIAGRLGGVMILAFDDDNARRLAENLLGRLAASSEQLRQELEESALMETGNILGCAYVNAIARLIDEELIPSAPYLLHDFAASVVEQALMIQAQSSDKALICHTVFHREGQELDWWVLFLPTTDLRDRMELALRPTVR